MPKLRAIFFWFVVLSAEYGHIEGQNEAIKESKSSYSANAISCSVRDGKKDTVSITLHNCRSLNGISISVKSLEPCVSCIEGDVVPVSCNIVIIDLCSETNYRFTLVVGGKAVHTCSAKTPGKQVPGDRPVRSLTNSGKTDESLSFTWDWPQCFRTKNFDCYKLEASADNWRTSTVVNITNPNSRSGVIKNLTLLTVYSIRHSICFKNGTGTQYCPVSARSELQNVLTKAGTPGVPKNFKVINVMSDKVKVSWEEPEVKKGPINGYLVPCTSIWPPCLTSKDIKKRLDYTFENLTPFTNYTLWVSAYNLEYGTSGNRVTGQAASKIQQTHTAAPSAPKSLKISSSTNTSLTITWQLPSTTNGPIEGYIITGNFTASPVLNKKALNHLISNLLPFTAYQVNVQAYNLASDNTNRQLVGKEASVLGKTNAAAPGAPGAITIGFVGSEEVKITWLEPAVKNGPVNGYRVSCKARGDGASCKDEDIKKIEKHTFEDLTPYTAYDFYVRAYNNEAGSSKTKLLGAAVTGFATTQVAEPEEPSELKVTEPTSRSFSASWEEPLVKNGPISGYILNVTSKADRINIHENIKQTEKIFAVENLLPWKRYVFSVLAYNDNGGGAELKGPAASIEVQTAIEAPTSPRNVNLRDPTTEGFHIEWEAPDPIPGPTTYHVSLYRIINNESLQCDDENPVETVTEYTGCEKMVSPCRIRGLQPNSCYYALLEAETGIGKSPKAKSNSIRTLAGAPLKPSVDIALDASADGKISETSAVFKFPKQTFPEENGPITDYVVLVAKKGNMKLSEPPTGTTKLTDSTFKTWKAAKAKDLYRASPIGWVPGQNFTYSLRSDNEDAFSCEDGTSDEYWKCTLGAQDCKELSATEFCNGPLNSDTSYLMKIRAYTEGGYSETNAISLKTGGGADVVKPASQVLLALLAVVLYSFRGSISP